MVEYEIIHEHFNQVNNIRTIENDSSHFIWHQDEFDRMISPLVGKQWFLQMEHELPKKIEKNKNMYIQKEVWHRVFCTNSDAENRLIILIKDFKEPQC